MQLMLLVDGKYYFYSELLTPERREVWRQRQAQPASQLPEAMLTAVNLSGAGSGDAVAEAMAKWMYENPDD